MRQLFFTLAILAAFATQAQTFENSKVPTRLQDFRLNDSSIQKKWFISNYSALSAVFVGFRGGNATIFSAPMGIQLNRMLSNNLYAFAGVEIAPSYITFNQRFGQTDFSKNGFSNGFMVGNASQFAINPAAYFGLGYTNEARTFQIQGRLSRQQNNYFTDPSDFRNFINLDRQMRSNVGFPGTR